MDDIFLDREKEIKMTIGGNLPHWFQEGKVVFVTFRLADSLPASAREGILEKRNSFVRLHPQPWDTATKLSFKRMMGHILDAQLQSGYGSCVLRIPAVRQLLIQSFEYGEDYVIDSYVIMPNHVHILIIPTGNRDTETILGAIKGFCARGINRLLGLHGRLWQRESYDHIVRSWDEYKYYRAYIRDNPRNLHPDEYTLFMR